MAGFERHVTVGWQGGLMDGKGEAKAGTGAFSLPVTFASRIGEPEGKTSPEELMAAAHAACYAMVLSSQLGKKGGSADTLDVTATVVADKGDAGIKITTSKLKVVAHGLKGMDASDFTTFATEAEKGCPVSNAYRGAMQITVEAQVV
jgi:osmotically inducible protein OsmC